MESTGAPRVSTVGVHSDMLARKTRLDRIAYLLYRLAVLTDRYTRAFGAVRGPVLLACALTLPRMKGRLVRPRGCQAPVRIRIGTSDVEVYCKVFGSMQYEVELSASPEVIVDAGAYTGISGAWFALRYPNAQIIAVEPQRDNFELLVQNTRSFPNVRAVNAALWHENGRLEVADPGRGAWAFQTRNASVGSNSHTVQAVTVPELLERFGVHDIDFLKLDIEGSEKEVLESSGLWIEQTGAIAAELHDDFQPGCSRAFYEAVRDFPFERRSGETVFVRRAMSSEHA
jgi:FkbM family methyltransferase